VKVRNTRSTYKSKSSTYKQAIHLPHIMSDHSSLTVPLAFPKPEEQAKTTHKYFGICCNVKYAVIATHGTLLCLYIAFLVFDATSMNNQPLWAWNNKLVAIFAVGIAISLITIHGANIQSLVLVSLGALYTIIEWVAIPIVMFPQLSADHYNNCYGTPPTNEACTNPTLWMYYVITISTLLILYPNLVLMYEIKVMKQ